MECRPLDERSAQQRAHLLEQFQSLPVLAYWDDGKWIIPAQSRVTIMTPQAAWAAGYRYVMMWGNA